MEKIHSAARNVVLKRKAATVALPSCNPCASSSRNADESAVAHPRAGTDGEGHHGKKCFHFIGLESRVVSSQVYVINLKSKLM